MERGSSDVGAGAGASGVATDGVVSRNPDGRVATDADPAVPGGESVSDAPGGGDPDADGAEGDGAEGDGADVDDPDLAAVPANGGDGEDPDPTTRRRALRRVGAVILAANVALFLAKGGVYAATGSLAVGSEAVNSLADSVYSVVVLAGLYLTTRPADEDHPHGHERIEPFVSLFVAAGVFAAGAGVLWGAVESLRSGVVAAPTGPAAVAVLAVAAAAKFGLYRYCLRVGREARSPAVVAAGKDNRNDILAAGAALAGVVGAGLGMPALDPAAAAVVAVAILYTGLDIARDNLTYLTGAAPPEELRAAIVERALAHPAAEGVHDVVAHYVGPEVDVSLHVEVPGDLTLREAHDVESEIAAAIRSIPEVDDAFVHLDPAGIGEWRAEEEGAVGDGGDEGAVGDGGDEGAVGDGGDGSAGDRSGATDDASGGGAPAATGDGR